MPKEPLIESPDVSHSCVPAFWPMTMGVALLEQGGEISARNLRFIEGEIKIELRPTLATPNKVRLSLRTMALRDYGQPKESRRWSMRPMPATPP